MFLYLLPGADVYVDIFEHRLQRGVVPHAQVLDLDLSLLGPAVRDLRRTCARGTERRTPTVATGLPAKAFLATRKSMQSGLLGDIQAINQY